MGDTGGKGFAPCLQAVVPQGMQNDHIGDHKEEEV